MRSKWGIIALIGLGLFAAAQTVSAAITDPNIITGVVRYNCIEGTSCDTEPVVVNGGLVNGALVYVDRTFVFADANDLGGIDVVRTAVDDKANPSLQMDVTLSKSGTLFLLIDNRVGDNVATNPPTLGTAMGWVLTAGFVQTGYTVGVFNPSDSSTTYLTAFAKDIPAAGTISLGAQNDGTSRLTYLIAAIPAGWNLPPSVVLNVPASVQVAPGEALEIDAAVLDYGMNTTTTVLWEKVSGGEVVFSPDNTSEDVTVSFPEGVGEYVLRMLVTDGEGTRTVKEINVSVQIPKFALQASDHCEIGNDSNQGPTSSRKSTISDVKNYNDGSAQRRRVCYYKYSIADLKQEGKAFANSYLMLNVDKGNLYTTSHIYVYGVKEEADDFTLTGTTWATAPGVDNNPIPPLNSAITIDTLDPDDLSPLLAAFTVPVLDVWQATEPSPALDEFLNADTDGNIVLMFITYDPESCGFEICSPSHSRSEEETGLKGIILRGNVMTLTWATQPVPANNMSVSINLPQLSWTNPPAVGEITCDVFLGTTEPNLLDPDYGLMTLASGISGNSVTLPAGLLQPNTTYYWVVDVHDSIRGTTRGYVWTFNTSNAVPSVVLEKPYQYLWLGNAGDPASATAVINATVTDDGRPDPPGTVTLLWEQVSGPVPVPIDPNNVEDITLVLPEKGTYVFRLSASDGDLTGTAAVQIFVGADPCEAAKAKPTYVRLSADINNDCYVDLGDLAVFAAQWLNCNESMDAPCL
jgi:hypothetical protein